MTAQDRLQEAVSILRASGCEAGYQLRPDNEVRVVVGYQHRVRVYVGDAEAALGWLDGIQAGSFLFMDEPAGAKTAAEIFSRMTA
jgi:hypothetical protein